MKDESRSMSLDVPGPFPTEPHERSQWIIDQRPARTKLDPYQPYAFLVEEECSASREVVPVATIFLTNRECPWRCAMCDLWKNTLTHSVPRGAIPKQIDYALARLRGTRQVKLYNSGSFFDEQAIPREDYSAIAEQVIDFDRTIVECHPFLVTDHCLSFRDLISGRLEIAMGLETAHPETLERLNKRMTLKQFAKAARFLQDNEIDLRVFILVQPPFMRAEESLEWAQRSLDFAFDCGATAATLIPTRGGNGAMEALARQGEFLPPSLATVEAAASHGLSLQRGRVFVDLWDIRTRAHVCRDCIDARVSRLHQMNLYQRAIPMIECSSCGGLS
jgi:radical SAM enzyme (TIGR01210 family)